MRSILIIVLGLFCLAMGGQRPNIPDANADAAAKPYYDHFIELGKTYGSIFVAKSVGFFFKTLFGGVVGVCSARSNGRNSIELSSSAWSRNSDTFKEMLVFHELGHCLLGRGHTSARHSDGRPESLMNPSLFSQSAYVSNRDAYWKELFTVRGSRLAATHAASRDFGSCQFGR